MMMKYMKLIAVVCAAAWAVASTPESYAGPRKRAKEGKEQTVRKTPYEKLFDGRKHTTAVGELVTLHKIDGKVFFEIPLASMGRDMLLGTTPASTRCAATWPPRWARAPITRTSTAAWRSSS